MPELEEWEERNNRWRRGNKGVLWRRKIRRRTGRKMKKEEVEEEKGEEPEEKLSFLWHESLPDRSLWGRRRDFCWC